MDYFWDKELDGHLYDEYPDEIDKIFNDNLVESDAAFENEEKERVRLNNELPVYNNTVDAEWPENDSTFYLLASNGLFLCRNHPFFTSCVEVDKFPQFLESQKQSFFFRYPKIPQATIEAVAGFFYGAYEKYNSEAVVLVYYDISEKKYETLIPTQVVSKSSLNVKYDIPKPSAQKLLVMSIHSHASASAFHSTIDHDDEEFFPGIHITLGNIDKDPPTFSAEAVMDEQRFEVDPFDIIEKYEKRLENIPKKWLKNITVRSWWGFSRNYNYKQENSHSRWNKKDKWHEKEKYRTRTSREKPKARRDD